jgi:hypothetical protein
VPPAFQAVEIQGGEAVGIREADGARVPITRMGYVFFLSSAWATSGAVHRIDTRTGEERFLVDGNRMLVFPDDPRYGPHLRVVRHRYYNGGSFDPTEVFDFDGNSKVVRPPAAELVRWSGKLVEADLPRDWAISEETREWDASIHLHARAGPPDPAPSEGLDLEEHVSSIDVAAAPLAAYLARGEGVDGRTARGLAYTYLHLPFDPFAQDDVESGQAADDSRVAWAVAGIAERWPST